MFGFGNFFSGLRAILIALAIFTLIITVGFIWLFERLAMPTALELARERSVSRVNTTIARYLEERVEGEGLKAGDLYIANYDDRGRLTHLQVDAIEVNSLCAGAGEYISKELNIRDTERIGLPVGVLTGLGLFAHRGVEIPVYITPSGKAEADYETEVISTGIGQVNLRVWLVVRVEMGIVNPLINERFTIIRKLMLVNTVFSGEVPGNFYGVRNQ